MRTKARRDALEPAVVETFRGFGFTVYRLNDPGLPDLVLWKEGWHRLVAVEVKSEDGTLTPAQQKYTGPRYLVHSLEETHQLINTLLLWPVLALEAGGYLKHLPTCAADSFYTGLCDCGLRDILREMP